MIGRILEALRMRSAGSAPVRQYRPNELRREGAGAGRQRQAEPPARASRQGPAGERPPRTQAPPPDAKPATERPLTDALKTRSGLRQAWVLKEILGPPVGLRGPDADRPGM